MQKADFLIVGQGIAGTMLAYHLINAGQAVHVVDQGITSTSAIAAGLFNPITGRRFVKSWMIDDLLPRTQTDYHGLEKLLGKRFLYNLPIIRLLAAHEEQAIYEKALRSDNEKYIAGFSFPKDGAQAYCEIKGGGYVNTSELIPAFRDFLISNGLFIRDDFRYDDLSFDGTGIKWKNLNAGAVVFCEGYKSAGNPFFPGLPFNLAKGEILTLRIPGLNSNSILMSGGFLLPLGNDLYKLGSTYEWDDLELVPTQKGLESLLNILKKMTGLPFEIIDHQAGIRPAVMHRRPFLGKSPITENTYILNGMGTKGVILAPYFAKHLADHLLHGIGLNPEVDIAGLI